MRVARHIDGLHVARVKARVEHAGAHRGGRGVEVLHLLGHVAHVAHGLGQLHGLFHGGPGVRANKVGHHVLLKARRARGFLKASAKRVVDGSRRLAHGGKHRVAHMLGRQAQLARDMVADKLVQELVRFVGQCVVKAHAASHKDLLDAGQLSQVTQQIGVGVLLNHHVAAQLGPHAALVRAHAVLCLLVTGRAPKVCGRPAHVGDVALEVGVMRQGAGLFHDRVVASHLHNAPLVVRDGAKTALAKAAAVSRDGEAHLVKVKGRHAARLVVVGVPGAGIGQLVDGVQLGRGQGCRGRVLHNVEVVGLIGLDQAMCRDRVHVLVLHGKALRVVLTVFSQLLERGEKLVVIHLAQVLGLIDRARDPAHLVDRQTRVQRLCHLDDGLLAHAVEEKVGARVHQNRALKAVRPVVVVGQAPKARLDAAQDNGGVLKCPANEVRVDNDGAVGARTHVAAWRVEVL